jgi:Tannase and feruloyl esterase
MIGVSLSLMLAASSVADDADFASRCVRMSESHQDRLVVSEAMVVESGPAPANPFEPNATTPVLPRHCLIRGDLERRVGAQGVSYGIRMELRVPEVWNGRFLYQGGGGMDGMLLSAIGEAVTHGATQAPALARGYAVISTDSGHQARGIDDALFAHDQQARIDYEYAAIGKVVRVGKQWLSVFSGHGPERTYFQGCSNGGRQGLVAAQRFPLDFDGIVVGNPAFDLPRAATLANYTNQVYESAARTAGASDPLHWFTPTDFKIVQDGILAACDAADGLQDGFVFDHAACHFDIQTVACRSGQTSGCLSSEKVAAIARAQAGPRDASGGPIAGEWTYDGGTFSDGWNAWQMGVLTPDGRALPGPVALVRASLTDYFDYPPTHGPTHGGADEAAALLAAARVTAPGIVADSTMMTTFAARGAKLVMVTGWADPIFSAPQFTAWYDRLEADNASAGDGPTRDYARLFLVPGMNHCGGGPALDDIDALQAVVDWVENGRAPDALMASGRAFPGVTRPLCAYPKVARYSGRGDPRDAAHFECR